jgi:hypothetical protein
MVSRAPQTEHNAPCGCLFSGQNCVKKNLFPLQTGQINLRFGIAPSGLSNGKFTLTRKKVLLGYIVTYFGINVECVRNDLDGYGQNMASALRRA